MWSPALTVSTGETRRSMALPWYNTREDRPSQDTIRETGGAVMHTRAWNTLGGRREFKEEDDEDAEDEEDARRR
jgi:hypothetical protein